MYTVLSDLSIYNLARELKSRINYESSELEIIINKHYDDLELEKASLFNDRLIKCNICGDYKHYDEFYKHNHSNCKYCTDINYSKTALISILRKEASERLSNEKMPCDDCDEQDDTWECSCDCMIFKEYQNRKDNVNTEAERIANNTINNDHILLKYMIKKSNELIQSAKDRIKEDQRYMQNKELAKKEFIIKTGIKKGSILVFKSGDRVKVTEISGSIFECEAYQIKTNGELSKKKRNLYHDEIDYIITNYQQ